MELRRGWKPKMLQVARHEILEGDSLGRLVIHDKWGPRDGITEEKSLKDKRNVLFIKLFLYSTKGINILQISSAHINFILNSPLDQLNHDQLSHYSDNRLELYKFAIPNEN